MKRRTCVILLFAFILDIVGTTRRHARNQASGQSRPSPLKR